MTGFADARERRNQRFAEANGFLFGEAPNAWLVAHRGLFEPGMQVLAVADGDGLKRQIEYVILGNPQGQWDARVAVNSETIRAMTAYSYIGNNQQPPRGFVVALLGEDRSVFLVFRDGDQDWLEYGDFTCRTCN